MAESALPRIGAVLIGRNEGARLQACLTSLPRGVAPVIYVDSGSTDGSLEAAQTAGAEPVALDPDRPFTAARARNAGLARLTAHTDPPVYVQFVDGDCTLVPGWIETAAAFLEANPRAAVACGRRRERFPDASLYNAFCDAEWNTPVGEAKACGGDALMRVAAVEAVGGFRPDLIAGEEPELCLRLRAAGWRIHRLDAEMTLHDAAMTRFSQWWKRARRAGHTYAEGVALHGHAPERHNLRPLLRTLGWALGLPVAILLGLVLLGPWALLLALAWPLQVLRLAARGGFTRLAWASGLFSVLGKFAELQGVLGYGLDRVVGRRARLIEYK